MPFQAETKTKDLKRVAESLSRSQDDWNEKYDRLLLPIDPRLSAIMQRCLSPSPLDRPLDFQEIQTDLQRLLSPIARFRRLARRRPRTLAGLSAGGIATVIAASLALPLSEEARLLQQAKSQIAAEEYDESAQLLRPFVEKHPRNSAASRLLATSLLKSGEADAAAELYMSAWRNEKQPLDIAMVGYCKNLLGEHVLAVPLYKEAEKNGLNLAAIANNHAASLLPLLADNFDEELSRSIEESLLHAYELAPQSETVRITMLRHYLQAADNPSRKRPVYHLSITALPPGGGSVEFCAKAAQFLVRRLSSEKELNQYGLPVIRRLVALEGPDALAVYLGAGDFSKYQFLLDDYDLNMIPRILSKSRVSEFLDPLVNE